MSRSDSIVARLSRSIPSMYFSMLIFGSICDAKGADADSTEREA